MKRFAFGILAFSLLLGSCSIERRHYRSGFYIDRKDNAVAAALPAPQPLPSRPATLETATPAGNLAEAAPEQPVTPHLLPAPARPAAAYAKAPRPLIRLPLMQQQYAARSQKDTIYVNSAPAGSRLHPDAKTAQLLGILSIVAAFTLGVGFLLAPVAIVIGLRAKSRIESSNGAYYGMHEANTGIVLGIITSAIFVIGLILMCIFVFALI